MQERDINRISILLNSKPGGALNKFLLIMYKLIDSEQSKYIFQLNVFVGIVSELWSIEQYMFYMLFFIFSLYLFLQSIIVTSSNNEELRIPTKK